jgi:hypothetical protein
MLSVRRRQEDAGGALRGGTGGGMDEDGELEEGEAYGDDTAFVDPDVALSYIVSARLPRPPAPFPRTSHASSPHTIF